MEEEWRKHHRRRSSSTQMKWQQLGWEGRQQPALAVIASASFLLQPPAQALPVACTVILLARTRIGRRQREEGKGGCSAVQQSNFSHPHGEISPTPPLLVARRERDRETQRVRLRMRIQVLAACRVSNWSEKRAAQTIPDAAHIIKTLYVFGHPPVVIQLIAISQRLIGRPEN